MNKFVIKNYVINNYSLICAIFDMYNVVPGFSNYISNIYQKIVEEPNENIHWKIIKRNKVGEIIISLICTKRNNNITFVLTDLINIKQHELTSIPSDIKSFDNINDYQFTLQYRVFYKYIEYQKGPCGS